MSMLNLASNLKSTNVRSIIEHSLAGGVAWMGRRSPALGALAAESLFLSPRRHPRPARELRLLAKARAFRIPLEDRSLPAWEWGDGPSVLLVHGWEGRGSQLGAFVAPLVRSGHRVITLDLPGHGDAYDARLSVVDLAHVLVRVQPALGPLHGVIAHSVGAAASAYACTVHPLAERLALIAPPRSPRRFFDGFMQHLNLDAPTAQAIETRLTQRYGISMDAIDVASFGPAVQVPTLVIHDRDDREVPLEHGAAFVRALPRAELLETQGLGHRRVLRDAEVVRAATSFVASARAVPFAEQLDQELFAPSLRQV